jgi:hypothetical protein
MFAALTGCQIVRPHRAPFLRDIAPNVPGSLVDFVERALAEAWPDAATMQSALRTVRAIIVERPRRARALPPGGRVAFALTGALLSASILWMGTTRRHPIGQGDQPVLASAAQPEPVHASSSEAPNPVSSIASNAADEVSPAQREALESGPVSVKDPIDATRGPRTRRRVHRSLAAPTVRPAVGEVAAASTSPTTPDDVTVETLALATRTAPTHPAPLVLSDLLDRRK